MGPSLVRTSVVVTALALAAPALAAPLLRLRIEGRPAGSSGPFSGQFFVSNGSAAEYRVVASVAPIGTSNTQGDGTRTITSLVPGTDGLWSLRLSIVQEPVNGQVPVGLSPVALSPDWAYGPAASGGTPVLRPGGGTNLDGVAIVHDLGTAGALGEEELFRGTFAVPFGALHNDDDHWPHPLRLSVVFDDDVLGVMRINGSPLPLRGFAVDSPDPIVSAGFPLWILPEFRPVPEPCVAAASLVAGVPLLLARRRRPPNA